MRTFNPIGQYMEELQAHPFQKTLGPGPYKFVGMFSIIKPSEQNPTGNLHQLASLMHPRFVTGAGTCAHCNTAIMNVCQVMVGNGDVYGVGTDCIEKVGMPAKELTKLAAIQRERAKKQRADRKQVKGDKARAELTALVEINREKLRALPHGFGGTRTMLDYALYCIERSNSGGIVIVLDRVKSVLGDFRK